MDIIKSLFDLKVEYNEDNEAYCQAYTEAGDKCSRLGKYINVDISNIIKRYTGMNPLGDMNCCMFCKQHVKKIAKDLAMICMTKLICWDIKDPAITGYPRDYNIDLEEQYKQIEKLRKIGDSGKPKPKKKKQNRK